MAETPSNAFHLIRSLQVKGGFLDGVRLEFDALSRSIDKLVQANLGSGLVEVEIETDSGLTYRVRRSYGGAPMVPSASGEAVPIEIGLRGGVQPKPDRGDRQRPTLPTQADRQFIAADVKEIHGQIEAHLRDLRGNAAEILKARAEVTDLKEKVSQLPRLLHASPKGPSLVVKVR